MRPYAGILRVSKMLASVIYFSGAKIVIYAHSPFGFRYKWSQRSVQSVRGLRIHLFGKDIIDRPRLGDPDVIAVLANVGQSTA